MKVLNQEPVLTVGALVAVLTAGLQWARIMGWIGWTEDQFQQFMVFVSLLLPLVGAAWARAKVTPTANPRDIEGRRLVPMNGEYPQ